MVFTQIYERTNSKNHLLKENHVKAVFAFFEYGKSTFKTQIARL